MIWQMFYYLSEIKMNIDFMADFDKKKYLDEAGLKKFWQLNKQYIEEYIAKKLFVGETAEYATIADKLDVGALVILTDAVGGTTAKLGQAILGTMVLGQA